MTKNYQEHEGFEEPCIKVIDEEVEL